MKKILILFGGNSFEHKISCMSAKSILQNIDYDKYFVTPVGINFKNEWFLYNGSIDDIINWENCEKFKIDNITDFVKSFDVVFPILHGANGEDGRLQGMFDLFGIKYVGCKTLSSALCMDKVFTKRILDNLNIPIVPFVEINGDYNIKDITNYLSFPMIVKPANGGSSIGISKVKNKKELKKAIRFAKKYDSKLLIEKFIDAKELECSVLVDGDIVVSDVGEIKSANEFYDYNAKYENKESFTIIPAEIDNNIKDSIKDYAKRAFMGVNASGLSRVDFLYDKDNNKIYLNEINTMPGFTEISMFPKLFEYKGYSYSQIISLLIDNA